MFLRTRFRRRDGKLHSLARSSRTCLRYCDKLAKPDVLVLDDVGMRKLTATEAQDLCEMLEERSLDKSPVLTAQLLLDHWAKVIADPVIADGYPGSPAVCCTHDHHHRRELPRRQSHKTCSHS
jgi:hypothetical protein